MNTGLSKVNLVASEPSSEIVISLGFLVTILKGKILSAGLPPSVSMIATVTGMLLSLDLKNKSIEVKNAPSPKLFINVCPNAIRFFSNL